MTTTTAIPQAFTKTGFRYRLIEQLGNVGIYEQTHKESGRLMAFEILIVRTSAKDWTTPTRTVVPAGSPMMPGNESWGVLAWTARTLTDARKRMEMAAEDEDKRNE